MNPPGDNPALLCQDCSRPLFRWFMSRIGWRGRLATASIGHTLPAGAPLTCWGLRSICADLSPKCRAAGECVLTPSPADQGTTKGKQ